MPKKWISSVLPGLLLSAVVPCLLHAQAPATAPAKSDSAEVQQHIEKAKKIAGAEWATEVNFLCIAPRRDSPEAPLVEPTRIFDNVYVFGRTETALYAITTSDGIILIDSGYPGQVDSVLLPGLKKLDLDPVNIKYVIVTHGHADHFAGATYLQEHYGTHVVMGPADWDMVENTPAPASAKPPKRDVVATEGQSLTLGDEKVILVFTPGHTPGAMALIFPVKDGGKTHMAGLFGGTVLTPAGIPHGMEPLYLHSIEHFKEEAQKAKVDVELENHPLMDGFTEKLTKLQEREKGDPNPFVVGEANYLKFLDVMTECMNAQIARHKD